MKVIISGGGTGGHINPGVAIAKKIKEEDPEASILFVGTEKGLEKKLVPKEGFKINFITVEGLNKKFSVKTFSSLFKSIEGFFQASKIINDFKPDIVIGTGGYVCGPVVLSAALKGIPTVIHEQNAIPGMTNKLLSKFVTHIAIAFKESVKYFPDNKTIFTGNPIRSQIFDADRIKSRVSLGMDINKPLLFVVGGSRGAKNINMAVCDIIEELITEDIQLLFVTGEVGYDDVIKKVEQLNINLKNSKGIKIVPYIYNMQDALAACDLMISRAGATTLSEITALGVPAILIPSPYVANNHQEYNALAIEQNGAAILIKESHLKDNVLAGQVISIIKNHDTLEKMAQNSKKLAVINATDIIYKLIKESVK